MLATKVIIIDSIWSVMGDE